MDLNLINTLLGIAASVVVIVTALVIVWRTLQVAERKRPVLVSFVAGVLAGGVVVASIALVFINVLRPSVTAPSRTTTTTLPLFPVASTAESGVEFQAPSTGTYTIRVASGAYQPLPPGSQGYEGWTTLLDVYVSKPVEFGYRYRTGGACEGTGQLNCSLISPVHFTAEIGSNGFESDPTSAAQAAAGHTFVVHLQKGDYLTFVALDEKGGYGDNVGAVEVELVVAAS